MRPILIWLAALLALAASAAHAELPPRPTGPVADLAAIIPDSEESALDGKLRAYNKATGRAIIVATVPSLDGQVIDRYAQELARFWEIGGAESQEAVLLVVAPKERKIRIHAAVGSQGRLTDGLAGRIIRETISPRFKAGDFGGGIAAGVDQISAQLDRDPVDAQAVAEAAEAAKSDVTSDEGGTFGSVFFWIVMIIVLSSLFGRGRRGARRSGIDPGIVLWGASEVFGNSSRGGGFDFGGGGSDGGFGGFGGGGGGFDGGGASGDW